MKTLDSIIESNEYSTRFEVCQGCDNHCRVRLYTFSNGKTFAGGNNCEKVYSSFHESKMRGINLFQEKYRLLFGNRRTAVVSNAKSDIVLCIPRGLGIYENYPFWNTLFAECGIRVILSGTSTMPLFEKGVRTIMADNICFPAKLMHGHMADLVEKIVAEKAKPENAGTQYRIFYPYVVYEKKEDERSRNSFNCPIVSAYSDVIRSAIDPEKKFGIPFDSPVFSFNSRKMLFVSAEEYLTDLGIDKKTADEAVKKAIAAQEEYLNTLEQRGLDILRQAEAEGRMVLMLAGRPYHTDPLIEHKISHAIADMGVDVITEHAARHAGQKVYDALNAVTQWAYPNRIFKAAQFVGEQNYAGLQMVELTSFGCGPDAFILDEVQAILNRYHKNLTILKIDDVNNIGSLKLRVRSLVESTQKELRQTSANKFITTKTFEREDRRRTIIAPYFAEGYSEFIPSLFSLAGYNVVNLPMGNQKDAEAGLRYANNDVCYPATIVIGSIMNALNSGKYDLKNTAVIITQTGGQCRATNYFSLIKNAMVRSGYQDVPLLSMATSADISNTQPGFEINWRKLANITIHAMAYADALNRLYHSAAVRTRSEANVTALQLREKFIRLGCEAVEKNDTGSLIKLMHLAVDEFSGIIDPHKQVPVMGLVGEIYVKYNSFSHKNVVNWLLENGVEVVPPSIIEFFSTSFVSRHANRELHIREEHTPTWMTDGIYRYIRHIVKKYDKICAAYPCYRPSSDIFEIAKLSKQVISTAADFGEGWFLPGEICHLAETGVKNVISLQPFGCIANHIISKGIEKKLRSIYPQMNMLFLDFDSSTSEANIYNRLHFLVDNARKNIQ